jgi:hypothetical protein
MSPPKRMRRSEPAPGDGAPDDLTDTAIMRLQIRKELSRVLGANLQLSTRTGLGGVIAYLATMGLQQAVPAVGEYDTLAVIVIMWLITRANRPTE